MDEKARKTLLEINNSQAILNYLRCADSKKMNDFKKNIQHKDINKFFADNELVSTALSFFKFNLNISATSKNIFMHRNTLVYRLEKIHKLTGLDIKTFRDAMILNILLLIKFGNEI